MNFLWVTVTFYEAVNIIHDVIFTAKPYPHTATLMFVGVRGEKDQQIRH